MYTTAAGSSDVPMTSTTAGSRSTTMYSTTDSGIMSPTFGLDYGVILGVCLLSDAAIDVADNDVTESLTQACVDVRSDIETVDQLHAVVLSKIRVTAMDINFTVDLYFEEESMMNGWIFDFNEIRDEFEQQIESRLVTAANQTEIT